MSALQEKACKSLLIADKYGMTRPIQRYAQHVEGVLLPSMQLQDALNWFNVLCYACHDPTECILQVLLVKIKDSNQISWALVARFINATPP